MKRKFHCLQIHSCVLALFLSYAGLSTSLLAGEPDNGEDTTPLNRLDFTTVFFDSFDSDQLTGLFGYTRNLSSNSNLNLSVAYLDSRFGLSGGSGLGDTTVTWSYLPNQKMSAGPWVPRFVGSGVAVTLPTGKESQGRGLGSTIITPFIGTAFLIGDSFSITPNLAYAYSINPIVTDKNLRVAALEIGFTWVRKSGWWFSVFPGYVRDFKSDNTTFTGRLSVGKAFANNWGLSAHYIEIESFAPGILPVEEDLFNKVYELTLHYGF